MDQSLVTIFLKRPDSVGLCVRVFPVAARATMRSKAWGRVHPLDEGAMTVAMNAFGQVVKEHAGTLMPCELLAVMYAQVLLEGYWKSWPRVAWRILQSGLRVAQRGIQIQEMQ